MFVCCFSLFKKSFCPARDESEIVQGFLLHVFPIINKKVVLIPTLFLFFACSRKMVTQKNKKIISLIILKYLHNHSLYLSKSIIKSCINKPVETLTMCSLPTLSSLCLKPKKRMKRLPMKSLTYWGI
jgi:hypothetical protein